MIGEAPTIDNGADYDSLLEGLVGPDHHIHYLPSNGLFDGLCDGCEAWFSRFDMISTELDHYTADGVTVDMDLLMADKAGFEARWLTYLVDTAPPAPYNEPF